MGHMKNFDIRIRNGGDDAIAAVSEYVAELRNEITRQARLMCDARLMLVGSPVGSGCYEAFRLLNEEPSPWIPVEERLPDVDEHVLACWVPRKDGMACAVIRTLNGKNVWTPGDQWTQCDPPTHWQPLPSPPAT